MTLIMDGAKNIIFMISSNWFDASVTNAEEFALNFAIEILLKQVRLKIFFGLENWH